MPVRALVFAGMCAFAVLFAINFGDGRLRGGPLDEDRNESGSPARPGLSTAGMYSLVNNGGRRLRIDAVRLGPHSKGVRLVGVRAYSERKGQFILEPGFPSIDRRSGRPKKLLFVHGLKIAPHGSRQLLVGLRVDRPGRYVLRGLEVKYRVLYPLGVPVPYRRLVENTLRICVSPVGRKLCAESQGG